MKRNPDMRSVIIILSILNMVSFRSVAQNLIVRENRNPGTEDWILTRVRTDTCKLEKPYKADYSAGNRISKAIVRKPAYRQVKRSTYL